MQILTFMPNLAVNILIITLLPLRKHCKASICELKIFMLLHLKQVLIKSFCPRGGGKAALLGVVT